MVLLGVVLTGRICGPTIECWCENDTIVVLVGVVVTERNFGYIKECWCEGDTLWSCLVW